MKNKKIQTLIAITLLVLSSMMISAVEINYSVSSYDDVEVSSIKYEPYPTNPGEYFDLWVKVYVGSSNYAKIEFVEDYPFSLDNDDDLIQEFDSSGDYLLHYTIRVDEDAVEGINELELKISSNRYDDLSVTGSFDIYISDAQTDFDLVVQDSSDSEISIAIANIGKNTANSMIVRIPEQEDYTTTGTNGQMVGNLDAGDYTIVSFTVASTTRDAGDLTIQIDYTDNIGERRSVTKEISLSGTSTVTNNSSISGMATGEFPEGGFQRNNSMNWSYIIIPLVILVLLAGGFVAYKNKSKIAQLIKKKKKDSQKNEVPDWVKKNK
ncbi:hypothetical protein M0R72_04315 [Candidatus Pacearchaeota archaeon]|jgi:hypothetical protein|nr:hypothetical protein [Candidatus Pacearchaeota archaeon]